MEAFFRKLIQAVGRFEAKQIINFKLRLFQFYIFLSILARFFLKSTDQCRRCHTFYNGKCRISKA